MPAQAANALSLLATEPLRRASNRSVVEADVLRATGRPLQNQRARAVVHRTRQRGDHAAPAFAHQADAAGIHLRL